MGSLLLTEIAGWAENILLRASRAMKRYFGTALVSSFPRMRYRRRRGAGMEIAFQPQSGSLPICRRCRIRIQNCIQNKLLRVIESLSRISTPKVLGAVEQDLIRAVASISLSVQPADEDLAKVAGGACRKSRSVWTAANSPGRD
jgi:hypothetical protein